MRKQLLLFSIFLVIKYNVGFFFWLRKLTHGSILLQKKTKLQGITSDKRSYIIRSGLNPYLKLTTRTTFLAKKWATKLPIRLTKEKLHKPRLVTNTRISPIKCPYSRFLVSLARIALMITSASPSTKHSETHNSFAKTSALLQANASTTAGGVGRDTL